jgi:hypothetical protein
MTYSRAGVFFFLIRTDICYFVFFTNAEHMLNPCQDGPFDALMQSGQKFSVSLPCLLSS